MKHFTCAYDVPDIPQLVKEALALKKDPLKFSSLGKNKTLGLVFMNPSLRTRMSTQKAAQLLGMNILSVNASSEGWALETGNGPMNGKTVEHVKEAAAVMGQYCDILAVREFPSLTDRQRDDSESNIIQWMNHSRRPFISLESATRHPLQSLADLITIEEHKKVKRLKVVLTWAPHVKPVPQAVANSFSEWMYFSNAEFVITCPPGMELNPEFTSHAHVTHAQEEALDGADFVYVKSWASYSDYGKFYGNGENWMITPEKLELTNEAKVMHCLPVRRDVELSSAVLESDSSLVIAQAQNRVVAAQAVLKKMIEALPVSKTESHPETELYED